ncbi:hypothetical protein D8682_00635 (plasmid) [Buttiauxella sp. 3AFRM03]|uniref:hypothetical protein n=1 Tax=Buttiauxella sp. 3AFRM03 TaxID=2479367 RepID=UPI000EF7CCD5|nr:hypothetical protein [Buttiauxella sp. 3AFRM03]AYN25511.1 hypothetical protein D8682_00015 [Buttiauxella sp. 3AFRM03]AYN25615.1 hypothetical protein D8682_00635 [Buttiauxella sp. 3AFRM03]
MAVRLYYNAADARARASDAWHDEWISKSGLKARFWTDKAISQFLGLPKKAGPILAWKQKDVEKVESTHEFQQWLAKRREWLIAHGKLLTDE